jgi:uncharacterized membrane protein
VEDEGRRDHDRAGALLVLIALLVALIPTSVARGTCIGGGGGRPGSPNWCYTEIARLSFAEHLWDGRVPYVDACPPHLVTECDEYPVLTMIAMWGATSASGGPVGMFAISAAMLLVAAAIATLLLWRLVGRRALFFAAAPTLLLYGPVNWDLLAVAAMVGAVALYLRGRWGAAGVATGLGVAAKLIPGVGCAPLVFRREASGRTRLGLWFVLAAVLTWLLLNVPFALTGFHGWSEFFRYNGSRPVDVDSLWRVGCAWVIGHEPCGSVPVVNALSALAFVTGCAFVWRTRMRHEPQTPPWTMGFAVLAIFFLTNKVYSPQYDLYLLPWFALVLPDVRAFAAFELAGIAIFFSRYRGFTEPSVPIFRMAILLRAAVLIVCLVTYARARRDPVRRAPGRSRPASAPIPS